MSALCKNERFDFEFCGFKAIVVRPEDPNGKWIWKTEFFDDFSNAELALLEEGYTRVYYKLSDRYGSYKTVRLMHNFHKYLIDRFSLCRKCSLFGISRGGLYAFNYALFYPEWVESVYLDNPVLDLRTWHAKGRVEYDQMLLEYSLSDETLKTFGGHPVNNIDEYLSLNIPTLVIAGDADEAVPYPANSERLIKRAAELSVPVKSIVKPGGRHHPHGLADPAPIVDFVKSI